MVPLDPMSPMHPRHWGTRKLSIVVLLLFVNVGVTTVLANQLTSRASASYQVKDATAVADTATDVADDNTAEQAISEDSQVPVITTYVVKPGDTLSEIAQKFNISVNTIRWANDLTTKTSKIKVGDELTILPVSGIEYKVKKGDTLSGIALKYGVDQSDILDYNDIEPASIKVGMKLVIPNAEPITPVVKKVSAPVTKKQDTASTDQKESVQKTSAVEPIDQPVAPKTTEGETNTDDTSGSDDVQTGTYANPIPGGHLTQHIHDGNAVDFGAPTGTPVEASAAGTVIVGKSCGRGYGICVVITHDDGSQTLYAHLSKTFVTPGQRVAQGERIALSGNTGRSTAPHLHFKIINGPRNPFAQYKIGTQF